MTLNKGDLVLLKPVRLSELMEFGVVLGKSKEAGDNPDAFDVFWLDDRKVLWIETTDVEIIQRALTTS